MYRIKVERNWEREGAPSDQDAGVSGKREWEGRRLG